MVPELVVPELVDPKLMLMMTPTLLMLMMLMLLTVIMLLKTESDPLGGVLGPSERGWTLLGPSWNHLGAVLGRSWTFWARF